jgi:hypothetical protein
VLPLLQKEPAQETFGGQALQIAAPEARLFVTKKDTADIFM